MEIAEFITEMESLMELDAGTLQQDVHLNTLSAWDSLAVIGYIALVDELLQLSVSPKDIAKAETIKDLYILTQEISVGS